MGIRVIISDSMSLSRGALAALIDKRDEIKLIGTVEGEAETLEFAQVHRPDISIIGFDGADRRAVGLAEQISNLPECRTLLLAESFTRSIVRRAFSGVVDGMLQRSASPTQFFDALHRVDRGERVFDADVTVAALANTGCPLSQRQLSVLERLSHGDTIVEIAGSLHLSEGTVRNYLNSLVTKLGARNRIDALRIARDAQWF